MNEKEEIIATIKLPLPVNGFIALIQALQKDFEEPLFIRNSPDGYEVFKKVKVKQP